MHCQGNVGCDKSGDGYSISECSLLGGDGCTLTTPPRRNEDSRYIQVNNTIGTGPQKEKLTSHMLTTHIRRETQYIYRSEFIHEENPR